MKEFFLKKEYERVCDVYTKLEEHFTELKEKSSFEKELILKLLSKLEDREFYNSRQFVPIVNCLIDCCKTYKDFKEELKFCLHKNKDLRFISFNNFSDSEIEDFFKRNANLFKNKVLCFDETEKDFFVNIIKKLNLQDKNYNIGFDIFDRIDNKYNPNVPNMAFFHIEDNPSLVISKTDNLENKKYFTKWLNPAEFINCDISKLSKCNSFYELENELEKEMEKEF